MTTSTIMRLTLAALVPGITAYTWMLGVGVLVNLVTACLVAAMTEAFVLRLREQPVSQLADGSALITGALLALCLPPYLPLWQVATGSAFAMFLGKHVYGGLGKNLFNPAMVGFAVMIIAFPLSMTHWPDPGYDQDASRVIAQKLTLQDRESFDGISSATPLDAYKFRSGLTSDEFFTQSTTANWQGWAIVNLAFLAGGIFLLLRGIVSWQTPVGFLATLFLLSLIFYDGGSSRSLGSPLFHLLSGATMLAAFFIITDPVTSPRRRDLFIYYGAAIGLVTFIIRVDGAYPEGVAFAVLLMNACAPLLDQVKSKLEQPA